MEREDKDEAELAQDAWLQSDEGAQGSAWFGLLEGVGWWLAQDARLQSHEGAQPLLISALRRRLGGAASLGSNGLRHTLFFCMAAAAAALSCAYASASSLPSMKRSTLCLPLCSALPRAAKVVSEEVRRKIEERQRREAAAEAAGPLSATQIARLQYAASQLLQPGETVAAGLKRLGGHSRRPAKRSKRGGDAADMAADVAPDPEAKEQVGSGGALFDVCSILSVLLVRCALPVPVHMAPQAGWQEQQLPRPASTLATAPPACPPAAAIAHTLRCAVHPLAAPHRSSTGSPRQPCS